MPLVDEARQLLDQVEVEFSEVRAAGSAWNQDEAGWLDVVLSNPTDATFTDVAVTFAVTGPVKLEQRALNANAGNSGNAGNAGNAGNVGNSLAIGPTTDEIRIETKRSLGARGGEISLQVKLIPEGAGGFGLSVGIDAGVVPTPIVETAGRMLGAIAPA